MPKCVRLGWILPFTPSPFEVGVWKRHYVENIKALQVLRPRVGLQHTLLIVLSSLNEDENIPH